jgi:hypothetical protein
LLVWCPAIEIVLVLLLVLLLVFFTDFEDEDENEDEEENARTVPKDNSCYSPEKRQDWLVCKIASLFQGMVNLQVNLFQ